MGGKTAGSNPRTGGGKRCLMVPSAGRPGASLSGAPTNSPSYAPRGLPAMGPLPAAEARLALGHEGLGGLAVVIGQPGVHVVGHLEVHAVPQLAGHGPVQVLLHVAVGD